MRPLVLITALCIGTTQVASAQAKRPAPAKKPTAKPAPTRRPTTAKKPTTPARKPAATASKPAPAPKAGPDLPSKLPLKAPFCVVNGEVVPISEFIDRLSIQFAPQAREALIGEVLIHQEARARKLTATPAEIDRVVNLVFQSSAASFGGPERMEEELKQVRGWSLADYKVVLRAQAQTQVLRQKLAETLVKPEEITAEEIQARYDERRRSFTLPESVRIAHILVRRPLGSDAAAEQKQRDKAEQLLKQLKTGADFAKVAQEHSEDAATAGMGGKIPVDIPRGANPFGAVFDATIYGAEVGLVDQIVPGPDGFHIVKVEKKTPGRLIPLEEVREQVRNSILAERRDQALEELLMRLRVKAEIETGKF